MCGLVRDRPPGESLKGFMNKAKSILFLMVLGAPVWGQPDTNTIHFDTAVPFEFPEATGGALRVETIDFNGDDHLDVLVTSDQSFPEREASLIVLLGDGRGGFAEVRTRIEDRIPIHSSVGDFDEDNEFDVALVSKKNGGGFDLSILLGDGSGAFTMATSFQLSGRPQWVESADMNADGHLDTLVILGDEVVVALGDGNLGGLGAVRLLLSQPARSLVIEDLDEDGVLDLAVLFFPEMGGDSLALAFGDGTGQFSSAAVVPMRLDLCPVALVTGDFTSDGHVDLVVGSSAFDTPFEICPRDLTVLAGDGSGGFVPTGVFPSPATLSGMAALDLNADGSLDIVATNDLNNSLSVFIGDGAGRLGFADEYESVRMARFLTHGDYNEDGNCDVVVGGEGLGGRTDVQIITGTGTDQLVTAKRNSFGPIPNFLPTVRGLEVGDLDEDGCLDMVTQTDERVFVVFGDGKGGKLGDAEFPVQFSANEGLSLSDLNLDDHLDIVTSGGSILLGDGHGQFCHDDLGFPNATKDVIARDFNQDGLPDLAIAETGGHRVLVYLGDGEGSFDLVNELKAPLFPHRLLAADLNHDDICDLVVKRIARFDGFRLSVFLGLGNGDFFLRQNLGAGDLANRLSIGDMNEDGNLDLVTELLYLGHGDGAFTSSADTRQGIVVDLDLDGHLDVTNGKEYQQGFGGLFLGDAIEIGGSGNGFYANLGDFDNDGATDIVLLAGGAVLGTTSIGQPGFKVILNRSFVPGCIEGNVNGASGSPVPVIFVNGLSGVGIVPTVYLGQESSFELRVEAAPSAAPGSSRFALYGWIGRPQPTDARTLRFDLGLSCRVMSMNTPSSSEAPLAIWRNLAGATSLLGEPTRPSDPAPTTLENRPGGIQRAVTFFLQGLIKDTDSPQGKIAVTNGLTVVVQ